MRIQLIGFILFAFTVSCSKQPDYGPPLLASLTVDGVDSITHNSAVVHSSVVSEGKSKLDARGIVWALTPNPTRYNHDIPMPVNGTDHFSTTVSGLARGTTYYVRTYGSNDAGTAYSEQRIFKTVSLAVPEVITAVPSNLTGTSATLGGTVADSGSSAVTERGVCWGTATNPDITTGTKQAMGNGVGSFSATVTLGNPATYFARAYAINSLGVSYGKTVTFITSNSPTKDDNMALGNPSAALANVGSPNNYLMVKPQFTLAYDNSRGGPKWVSWHLSSAWKGGAARCDCFTGDTELPSTFYKAFDGHYTGAGFTRGHMCPSEDRDLTDADNAATFLMTNMLPQSQNSNSGTWGSAEDYVRKLLPDNEMYIIAGGYSAGGSYSSTSGTITTIHGGDITVPGRLWKVIVILPVGSNDLTRITTSTRVIAIDTPNTYNATSQEWGSYRTSVDAIEAFTGLDLLSNIPLSIQNALESTVDTGPTE